MSTSQPLFDAAQDTVVRFAQGRALVLAAPGCGKTHLLTHRIVQAHTVDGVPYDQMLCLTFTNRASRSMAERVAEVMGSLPEGLFVGNIHRFCIRFLFDNALLPLGTTIIDDIDQAEILTELAQTAFDEDGSPRTLTAADVRKTIHAAARLLESRHQLPDDLHLHKHADTEYTHFAQRYLDYKRDNQLIDFDDILILTYAHLARKSVADMAYTWLQVDEVQDLNPLQLAIIDLLAAPDATLLYLGDERQAVYSFMGTDAQSVDRLAQLCQGRVFHLSNNYRSPGYLLDFLNDYAHSVLHVPLEQLPTAIDSRHIDDGLLLLRGEQTGYRESTQPQLIARHARRLYAQTEGESIGILVRSNQEAELLSQALTDEGLPHLSITRRDVFKSIDFKVIYAHFSVVLNDTRHTDWARLLHHTGVIESMDYARRCLRRMRTIGLTPTDLIHYDRSSYCLEAARSVRGRTLVVFDTETTGTDIFHDDIIQIAAVKLCKGKVVEGSELDLIIETDRPIPEMLGDLPNPMVEEYRRRPHLSPEEAFARFLDYIGDAEIVGHNVHFDLNILTANLRRRTPRLTLANRPVWDTLKLARLLDPDLPRYRLVDLLDTYGLAGENSHNAADDIQATATLLLHLCPIAESRAEAQTAFLDNNWTRTMRRRLLDRYAPLYLHTHDLLSSPTVDAEHSLPHELAYIHDALAALDAITSLPFLSQICELIGRMVPPDNPFFDQLDHHLYEIRSFSESDLFESRIFAERVFVMTLHKAKGLEFDHVILHNISEGIFPHPRSNPDDCAETARLLYVGLSRARATLTVAFAPRLSPFLADHPEVMAHFKSLEE